MQRNGIDYPLRDYHLRPSSRRNSPSRKNDYIDSLTNGWQPNSGRSTPSAAVRRALQVLDESYRHQDNNLRRATGDRLPSFRRGRSKSPSKSRTPSPVRKFLRDSNSPIPTAPSTPPRILEIERDNLQDALGDSESRRNVLLRKLAETQRTMEIQNDTVRKGETELRETKAAAKLLHQLQNELETKVQYLEKERKQQLNRQLQDAEEKETLRREADTFHHEMKRLQCQLELLETEKEERGRELNRAREEIRDVQDNNRKVLEKKSVLADEVAALKEHLAVAKQRIEMLEKEKSNAQNDARNLQESQQAIINRNTELSNRLNLSEDNGLQLRNKLDETELILQTCKHDIGTYKEKYAKQGYKLAELQTTHKDTQNDLDRSNRYISELERTLQSVKEINCQLKENKVTLEDNLTTLHSDLAKLRLEFSRTCEEKTRFSDELEILKKSQRDLSSTLAETRHQLAAKEEELSQLQASKKIDGKKMAVLETQKNQGERERDELASRLVSLQETHDSLQIKADQENLKTAQQLRELKVENSRLEAKYKDAETRLERLNQELTATLEHDQSQLDHWRETCTKLTSLIEERDHAQRESAARLQVAEEAAEKAETRSRALEKQLPALQDLQHELTQLRGENNRMTQECKENKQMIAVLEMERDVLAKSPNKSTTNGVLEAEMKKLQMAVDRLTAADSSNVRPSDNKEEEERRKKFDILETDLKRAQESNTLLADQLSQVKKEAETLHNLMEARTDTHEREVRKMEREKERLDSRIRSLEEEARVLRSSLTSSARSPTQYTDAGELRNLRVEVSRLKRELDEKEQNYLVTKGQLVVAQNARKSAEDRANLASQRSPSPPKILPDFSYEAEDAKRELETKKARLEAVEAECAILRSRIEEISEVRTKQENLIKNLRRQLKDAKEKLLKKSNDGDKSDDGERSALIELASTRRDLQRAFEDIASRDHQLAELRRSLVSAQKQEQKAKQQRDELKGKTIIMESITDSSGELRKEMDSLRLEKLNLEKQLNAFIKSKPSQTPHSSLNFGEDLDKEMEKQYKIVCDRNKWLENRINSLLREIDLLRDQNSLLLQEKSAAERQSEAMEGELKSVTISSKSSRQQSALEQIHLQYSNAEKMQQIMEMQNELREKNQLIQAMSKQLENAQKKTDKKKISSFMKKLRKSSESGGVTVSPERRPLIGFGTEAHLGTVGNSDAFSVLPTAFSSQNFPDTGYSSTLSLPGKGPKEKQNNNRGRSRSIPGDISKMFQATQQQDFEESKPRSQSYRQFSEEAPELPETMKGLSPSPTLTTGRGSARHGDNLMDSVHDYISDTGEPVGSPARRSPEAVQPLPEPPRKKAPKGDSSSDEDIRSEDGHARRSLIDTSEQFGRGASDRKRSYSSDRPKRSSKSHDKRAVMSADEFDDIQVENDFRTQAMSPSKQSRRSSSDHMPENAAPKPLPIPILPTPASSPSVLSPTSARNRGIQICVTEPGGSDNEHHPRGSVPQTEYGTSPQMRSPFPSPTFTSGTPTKSKSSKIGIQDLM